MQMQKSLDLGSLATKSGFGPWLLSDEKTNIIDNLNLKKTINASNSIIDLNYT